mmetsp:Transcript_6702/g.18778  ORF Transcript_6702/g.18778 Transcript_6702/m.18778 type:complete len:82 (-) Transcript_6702:2111-2356(-)
MTEATLTSNPWMVHVVDDCAEDDSKVGQGIGRDTVGMISQIVCFKERVDMLGGVDFDNALQELMDRCGDTGCASASGKRES